MDARTGGVEGDGVVPREAGTGAGSDGDRSSGTENASVTGAVSIEVPAWDRRRDRRATTVLFLIVWAIYLATATYSVSQINDTRATAQSAWSLGTRGSLALPEAWRDEIDWEKEGTDGRLYTNRNPGPIVWATPFYAVAGLATSDETPGHPYLISYAPAGVAAATAAALAIAASFVMFRRLASRRVAIVAACALAFGTAVWTVSADAMWNHSLTHLFIVLGVLGAVDDRHARSGLSFALAVVSRPQVAVIAAVIGIWKSVAERRLRPVVVIGVTSGLGAVALTIYSGVLFDVWLPVAGHSTARVTDVAMTSQFEFLERLWLSMVDPARGLLIYAPVLLVLLPLTHRGWRLSPWWVRASAFAGVLYLVVQLRSNVHHGGTNFFGTRLTIETLVLLSPLLLRTWQSLARKESMLHAAVVVLLCVSVGLHALGATIWARPFFDRQSFWEGEFERICIEERIDGCPSEGFAGL